MMVLMRKGWGGRNAAFRQIFTTTFFPRRASSSPTRSTSCSGRRRRQTMPPTSSRRSETSTSGPTCRGSVPTLVLHSGEDAVVPMKDGVELASGIAGARFVPLDSRNHVLLPGEPAWPRFVAEVEAFLAQETLS
jgi:pimeloyl-ACP methyl ester carboxylesterase